MPVSDLLMTKFTIPPARSALIPRSHLLIALDQGRSVPLTVLSASAGFGKTTLLSMWASQPNNMVAWVTLDEQDNDLTRFWAYVIAALRKCGAPGGEATEALLHSPHPDQFPGTLIALINELADLSQDITLILDDYHLIREQAIHDSLQFVLDHLPPCLHLLLSSRVEPSLSLARLRARGQMLEIRDSDLRLNDEETTSFLTQVMGLTLARDEVRHLEQRTEGWIAGLQLAALSLRRHDDVTAWLATFSGRHRFFLDYVQSEILDHLPPAQQHFLLYTSVLERMNAEICQALTGETASQNILESLERANLFLIPLDEERRWYRFHTLFREVLLARLQNIEPEQVRLLHHKAAVWYQEQGWLHEAIPHALATQDFFFVASLLDGYVERLCIQGELKTLLTWIKQLPEEVLLAHPHLATSYIAAFHFLSPFSEGEESAYLYKLRDGVEQNLEYQDSTNRKQLCHRLILLDGWNIATRSLSDGNLEQLQAVAAQMQHLEVSDSVMWQQHTLAPLAMAWRLSGNFPPMVAALQEGRLQLQRIQNRYQESQTLWGLVAAHIGSGQLRQAHTGCQELQHLLNSIGAPLPLAAYPHLFQAQLAYEWNQLDVARNAATLAIEQTTPSQYLDIMMGAFEALARICIAEGDLPGAEQTILKMEQVSQSARIPLFAPWIEGLRVRLWLAQGNLSQAQSWAEQTTYQHNNLQYRYEGAYIALAHVYLAKNQPTQALSWLSLLLKHAESVARGSSIVVIMSLQVAALQMSGETTEALRTLLLLLDYATPQGYIRVFLNAGEPMRQALQALLANNSSISPLLTSSASTILSAFASQHQAPLKLPQQTNQPFEEPLTPRELEVLYLLAEGTPNLEIARQLVVSLATAKKHVANIISKLGAENRTQAIAYARSRSLL